MKYFDPRRFSLILSMLVIISGNVYSKEYPVTQAKMDSVLAKSAPGDTIVLENGTYSDIVLNLRISGNVDNPIVLKAKTIGGVIFTGPSSRISIKADYCIIDGFVWKDIQSNSSQVIIHFDGANNNTFRNNTMVNSGRITPNSKTGILRLSGTSKNNCIEYNRFDNLLNLGIQVWAWNDDYANTGNIIRHNYFVNHKKYELLQLGQGGSSAFRNHHTVVEHNLFEDIDMQDPELISTKTSRNIIRHNTFRNCRSMLVLRTGEGDLVEGNWFFNSHGIRVHDKNHVIINNYIEGGPSGDATSDDEGIVLYSGYQVRPEVGNGHYPADSVLVSNNTVINHLGEHILVGRNSASWSNKPQGVTIKNNLVVNNSGIGILNEASNNSVWEQNMVYSISSGTSGNVDNVIKTNPLLIKEGSFFKLQAGSPAINSASFEQNVSKDIEGQNRNILDIGADEFSTDEIHYQPLDATDVGPGIGDGLVKYMLKTSVTGIGQIILEPAGNVYDSATVVTLTAMPAEGYKFANWEGIEDISPTQNIVMDEDKSVVANFISAVQIIPIDTVWASKSDGNAPENTIDNDLSTRWSAEDGPQSITYKLDSMYNVDYLMIAWFNGDKRNSYFEIAVSVDGMVWDTIVSDTSSGTTLEQEIIDLPDSQARFVRYIGYGNSSNDWNSITEVDIHGSLVIASAIENKNNYLREYAQLQNFPNPFSSQTKISFQLQKPDQVCLQIYNMNGQLLDTLTNKYLESGFHEYCWYPQKSSSVKTGTYVYRLTTSEFQTTGRMIYSTR